MHNTLIKMFILNISCIHYFRTWFTHFINNSGNSRCNICGMCVVTWLSPSTNHMHSAYSIPHFIFCIPHFRILLTPWVLGLRIDPLHLLAICRKRRLNQAFLNLHGLIWLLMMVWSKRGNINVAAVVIIAHCDTLGARCSRQLIGPEDWVFVTLGLLCCD